MSESTLRVTAGAHRGWVHRVMMARESFQRSRSSLISNPPETSVWSAGPTLGRREPMSGLVVCWLAALNAPVR